MGTKHNPWISIADLLSSVVMVVLLLFVMAIVGPKYALELQRAELMRQVNTKLTSYADSGMLKIHSDQSMLEFTSVTFESGSARLTEATEQMVADLAGSLSKYMKDHPQMEILIEGHTDPAPVQAVSNVGGYFADNIQLSTLRAANVRESLLNNIGNTADLAKRIGVAGYGETRLKNPDQPFSAENRRIEVRLLWDGQNGKK